MRMMWIAPLFPTKKELDGLLVPSSRGFLTCLFGLEGVLVDMDALLLPCLWRVGEFCNLRMPSKARCATPWVADLRKPAWPLVGTFLRVSKRCLYRPWRG